MTLNTTKKKLEKDLKTVGKNLKKGGDKSEKVATQQKKGPKNKVPRLNPNSNPSPSSLNFSIWSIAL